MNKKNLFFVFLGIATLCFSFAKLDCSPFGTSANNNSIENKILAGYQGWFNTKKDGADLGWKHYSNKGVFKQGSVNIDFWPDMTEYSKDHKYKTPFKHSDGKTAYLFSSADYKSVSLHFKWMKDYGIDGVFVQRFSVALTRG